MPWPNVGRAARFGEQPTTPHVLDGLHAEQSAIDVLRAEYTQAKPSAQGNRPPDRILHADQSTGEGKTFRSKLEIHELSLLSQQYRQSRERPGRDSPPERQPIPNGRTRALVHKSQC